MNIIIKGIISIFKNKTTVGLIVKVLSKLGISKFYLTLITGIGIFGGISYIGAKLTYQSIKSDYPTFSKFILDSILQKLGLVTTQELNKLQNYVHSIENKVHLLEHQNQELINTIQTQQITMELTTTQINKTISQIENVTKVIANETGALRVENEQLINEVNHLSNGVATACVQIGRVNDRIKNVEQDIETMETGFQAEINQVQEANEENSLAIQRLSSFINTYNSFAENIAVPIPLGTDNAIVRVPVHQIELKTESEVDDESSSENIQDETSTNENLENSIVESINSEESITIPPRATDIIKKGTEYFIDQMGFKNINVTTSVRPLSALSKDIENLREQYARGINQNRSSANLGGLRGLTYDIKFDRISTDISSTASNLNNNIILQNNNNLSVLNSDINNNNSNFQFYNPQTFDFEKYVQATNSAWWVSMRYRLYGFLNRTMNLNLGLDSEVTRLLSGNLTSEDINNLNNGVSTPAYDIYRLYFKKLDIIPPHVSQGLLMNHPSNQIPDTKQIEMLTSQSQRPKPKISLSKTSIILRQKNKQKLLTSPSNNENE